MVQLLGAPTGQFFENVIICAYASTYCTKELLNEVIIYWLL